MKKSWGAGTLPCYQREHIIWCLNKGIEIYQIYFLLLLLYLKDGPRCCLLLLCEMSFIYQNNFTPGQNMPAYSSDTIHEAPCIKLCAFLWWYWNLLKNSLSVHVSVELNYGKFLDLSSFLCTPSILLSIAIQSKV